MTDDILHSETGDKEPTDTILDPQEDVLHTPNLQKEAARALISVPKNEDDYSARVRAKTLSEALGNAVAIAKQKQPSEADTPDENDEKERATADAIGTVLSGKHDYYGSMWNRQRPFASGVEYAAHMRNLVLNGPNAGLTDEARQFYAADYDTQVKLALEHEGALDVLKRGAADVLDSMRLVQPLTRAEEANADEETRGASATVFVANMGGTDVPEEKYEAAKAKVVAFREKQQLESIRQKYEAKLNRDNAWNALTSILPTLSEDAQTCAQAIIDSPNNSLPYQHYAKFNSLSQRERELVVQTRQLTKDKVDSGFWNTLEDAAIGAANITSSIITAPFRQGSKYEGIIRDSVTGSDAAGLAVNDLAIKRQLLWQATGDFLAGGNFEHGELPQLQFERVCEEHGVIGESVIGAVSTLPYMGAAAIPYAGTALVALEAMQEFDDHVALNGGDITDPRYLMSSLIMGGLYSYVEKLQVEKLVGGISEQAVREGLLKGFWSGIKNGTVPRVLVSETLSESLHEGLQNGIMAVNNAYALNEDAVRAFGEAFVEDFVGSLGTMAIIGGGGLVIGHMGRSGVHFRGKEISGKLFSASELRWMERNVSLDQVYSGIWAHNNMVEAMGRTRKYMENEGNKELARLFPFWQEGGKEALVEKGGVDKEDAERFDSLFSDLRNKGDANKAAENAVSEWNRTRGIEKSPETGESGEIGKRYFDDLAVRYGNGGISRDDFTSKLVEIGFSESGALDVSSLIDLETRLENTRESLGEYFLSKYASEHGTDESRSEDMKKVVRQMRDLDNIRNVWARGMGIYRKGDDGTVQDPGAKALEEFGFMPVYAKKLSEQFHAERAAAYSRIALDGIRAMYEKTTKGRVSGKEAIASEFKGRVVRLPTGTDAKGKTTYGDFIRFNLPKNGGEAYVRIVESTTGAPDFTKADQNIANSIAETAKRWKKPVTADEWMQMTPNERENLWNRHRMYDEGYFTQDSKVSLVLDGDPAARIDSGEAKRIVFGTITLATDSNITSLNQLSVNDDGSVNGLIDSSAGFHEVYHAWKYFMKATGQWTEKEDAALAAKYGKDSRGRHNEEAAANALRGYMNRRVEGRMTAEDDASPFSRIYALAQRLIRRGKEQKVKEQIAANAEEAFLDQIIADNYTGVGDLAEKPKPAEAKPTTPTTANAPQLPGRKESSETETKGTSTETKPAEAETKPAPTETKPTATPKPAAQRGWTAYTPTGNVKVSGHYAVVNLADVIHSNNPAYALYMRAQLRNRKDNKAEEDTRKDIVNNFQGERLLEAPDTANGAPIVFIAPDEKGVNRMFVLSGNGRILVLNELAERHLYDQYRNVMKAWAAENGLEVPEGDTPVLVRVITDFGGATREKVADLSNTNSIQQYTEEEQARADAEVIKALDIAKLYHANANGTADMTPGVNDDFFSEFIRGVGDTSLYNSDRSLTETARTRAVRALLAIAVGQGDRGRDVVKKLIEQTDTLNIARQKNAAAIMAAAVAALESKAEYSIGPDVSRAMADFIDFAEKKKAGKIGTFDEYFGQMDLLDAPSEIAKEVLKLFGSKQSAADIAEYVVVYCEAAAQEDPSGGLFGSEGARSRLDIWNDAKKLVEERRAADGGPVKHSIKAETETLYHGSAADWIRPDLRHIGEGQGGDYQGYGLNMTTDRAGAEFWAKIAKTQKERRARGLIEGVKAFFSPEYVYSAELDDNAHVIGYYDPVSQDVIKALKSALVSESIHLSAEEDERLTKLAGRPFERLAKFVAARKKDGVRISPKTAADLIVRAGIDATWMPSISGNMETDRDYTIYNVERLKNYHQWANGVQKHSIKADAVEVTESDLDAALLKYGEAKDVSQAVYALPDGKLMRGKEISLLGGKVKSFGHDGFTDDIMKKIPSPKTKAKNAVDYYGALSGKMDAAKRAIAKTGAIRLGSEGSYLEIFKEPTEAQYDGLYDIVYDAYGFAEQAGDTTDITIDVSDTDLNGVFTVAYHTGTSPRRILEDLRGWYKEGVLPLGAQGPAANAANVEAYIKHSIAGSDFTAMAKYYQGDIREIARQLKKSNPYALRLAAETMARAVPDGAVLVPVPGHDGVARDTLALANEIAAITGSPVVEALRGSPRLAVYEQKQDGYLPSASELGFKPYAELPDGREVIFIDNVVGTGTTSVAAHDALGQGRVLAFAWDNTAPRPIGIVGGLENAYHSITSDVAVEEKTLDEFATRKGITTAKRRAGLKKTVDGFAKFAKEYRSLYRDAVRYGDWKNVLDFAEQHDMPLASNVLKQYFEDPQFDTKELVGLKIEDSADVAAILMTVRSPFVESFKAIYLDADKKILGAKILTIGQPSQTAIGKGAVTREMPDGTAFVVVSHNHPSGHPNPSKEDINLTQYVQAELDQSGAKLLDHIITDGKRYYSFNEKSEYEIDVKTPKWEMYTAGTDGIPSFSTQEQVENYIAAHLRDDGDFGHIIYINAQNEIVGVKRTSPGEAALGGDEIWNRWLDYAVEGVTKTGAVGVLVDLGPGKISDFDGREITKAIGKKFDMFNVHVLDVVAGSDDMTSWISLSGRQFQDKPTMQDFPKYSFAAGEIGSSNMQNALFLSAYLDKARQMLGKRDWAKIPRAERLAIKTATGWEKGADGKWRLEIMDLPKFDMSKLSKPNPDYADMSLNDSKGDPSKSSKYMPVKLGAIWSKKDQKAIDLFAAYPWIKDVTVAAGTKMARETVRGLFDEEKMTIFLNDNIHGDENKIREVFTHEIQHVIQKIENFARGGNQSVARHLFLKKYQEAEKSAWDLYHEQTRLTHELLDDWGPTRWWYFCNWPKKSPEYQQTLAKLRESDAWRDFERRAAEFKRKNGHQFSYFTEGSWRAEAMAMRQQYKDYTKFAGEVEARNAANRQYSPFTLLEDTEDTERRYQKLVNGAMEEFQRITEAQEEAEKHSFAGLRGLNVAGIRDIDDAEVLERRGDDRETIYRLTGWYRGADGLWRVELPFHGRFVFEGDFDDGMTKGYRTVGDYFDWPELFQAYPELRDVEVRFEDLPEDVRGDFDPKTKTIRIANHVRRGGSGILARHRVAPVMVHEIQHAIQSIENHARGGDPDDLLTWDRTKVHDEIRRLSLARDLATTQAEKDEISEMIEEHEDNLAADAENAAAKYYRLAGEVEARNAADRFFKSPSWRLAHPPWETEDEARENQIVDFTEEDEVHWDNVERGPRHSFAARLETVRQEVKAEGGDIYLAYHGTQLGGFKIFDQSKNDLGQPGFYFSKSRDTAMTYSSPARYDMYDDDGVVDPLSMVEANALYNEYGIYNVALKIMKPLVVECGGNYWHSVPNPFDPNGGKMNTRDVTRQALESGKYDAVIFKDVIDNGEGYIQQPPTDVYAVKNPEQIKVVDDVTYDDEGNIIPDSDRLDWDLPDIRHSVTSAWGDDFPDVAYMTTRKYVMADAELDRLHKEAKAGSLRSALAFVDRLMPDEPKTESEKLRIQKIRDLAADHPRATLIPVLAIEASGHNMLPFAYAKKIEQLTGLKVMMNIRQSVKANHTGASALERIARRAEFVGNVMRGRDYIMVDDHVTQGVTFAALRRHILDRGGKVVAATTLTTSRGSSILSPRDATLDKLTAKFGSTFATELKKAGVADVIADLTESQAQQLLKYSVDSFRVLSARSFDRRSREISNQAGPGYAGLVRAAVRSGSQNGVGDAAGLLQGDKDLGRGKEGSLGNADHRVLGAIPSDVRRNGRPGSDGSGASYVNQVLPAFRKYFNPEIGKLGSTRFANAEIIRGQISKDLDAVISEALNAREASGDEKVGILESFLKRIKSTKEGKSVFGRYREGSSYNGSEAEKSDPKRREIWDRIYKELALDPVTGKNSEALEINKRTGKLKGAETIERSNAEQGGLPRISLDENAQYTPSRDRRLDIVMGPPAAGKSSVFVNLLSVYHRSRVFDSDAIKKRLPGFDKGNGASYVHEESSALNKEIIQRFLARNSGENVVLPIVGATENSVRKYIDQFRGAGYTIYLHNNYVPILHAFGRAWERTLTTGRLIAPEVFLGCMDAPSAVFERMRNEADFWDEFDNDGPLGSNPLYVRGNYVDPAYGRITKKPDIAPKLGKNGVWTNAMLDPQMMLDFAEEMDYQERKTPIFAPRLKQQRFDFGSDAEGRSKHAIRSDLRENREKAATEALTNWITYFRLSHGSVPMTKTIARMGLAMGMSVVDSKRILKASETRAEQMRGSLIEKAAQNGDIATTMALLKREDGIDEIVGNLLAGGVAKGGELTHRGVGQINTILEQRDNQIMRDMTAATLANMQDDTGLDLAAEILEQKPEDFDEKIKGAKGTDPNAPTDPNAEQPSDTDAPGGDGGAIDESHLSDLERFNREQARKEALKKVEELIAKAKAKAAENKAKAEERRRRAEENGEGSVDSTGGGDVGVEDMDEAVSQYMGGITPKNVKANFKNKEEFAAFMRAWAEVKFDRTHGVSTLGKTHKDKLFAEFYRITVRQQLQDLADKLLAPKDENGVTISRIAKLGNGARNVVSRQIARMEKGLRPDTIERMSANIFGFINSAAIRVSRTDLVSEFKKELKDKYIKGEKYEDLKLDSDRRVTGWVEEAARYICRVCDLSKRSINGDITQLAAERKELLDIINRRADVYDESGKEVALAAVEDMETKKAMWKLALLDKYGAMTSLMPGEILDLRKAAFEYLENQAADLERLWRDHRAEEEGIRRALAGAIVGPNGQKYTPSKNAWGWFESKVLNGLNGLLRLRLLHLTRFADDAAQKQAKNAINSIVAKLGNGCTRFERELQKDRSALYQGLGKILAKNGQDVNRSIKRYLERLNEPIPLELSRQISNQGNVGTMTYGQMIQLLVSLEQRSFKEAIEYNGRQGQAELIRTFTTTDKDGKRVNVFTAEDNMFVEWLRAFYESKRDVISPVMLRMVGHEVDSPDPLYCPVKRSMEGRVKAFAEVGSTWDPISAVFTRRIKNNRDFDENVSIIGMFQQRSEETAKIVAWSEQGTIIRGVFTNPGIQSAIERAFGPGELRTIINQLLATFNGGKDAKRTPGEIAAVDKVLNFTTYAYLGFNPLSSAKQTTSFPVWANVLPGGFKDLWKHMTHVDTKIIRHLKESDEYKVRYGEEVGSGMDIATKSINENPSMNPVARFLSGPGMWMLKKADFAPGAWIAQGVYKEILDKHMQEGMSYDEADRLAITETFNLLEETQQSGRVYNTNMLTIEHGRIGRFLTQFTTSPLQQLQYEAQALRELIDMVRYGQGEKKIAAARQKLVRAAIINHLLLPAALNFVTAVYKKIMGDEPPWEEDGYHWSLLIDILLGQASRIFFIGTLADTSLRAFFKREFPRGSQIIPSEGAINMSANFFITLHDVAISFDAEKIRKDIERLLKSTAPTRIPYSIYRLLTGDADVDRKAEKEKTKKRKQ